MVGDYIATAFAGSGAAFPVIAAAQAPVNGVFNEALETSASGLARQAEQGRQLVSSRGEQPVVPLAEAPPAAGVPRTAH